MVSNDKVHRLVLLLCLLVGLVVGYFSYNIAIGGLIGLAVGFLVIIVMEWTEKEEK